MNCWPCCGGPPGRNYTFGPQHPLRQLWKLRKEDKSSATPEFAIHIRHSPKLQQRQELQQAQPYLHLRCTLIVRRRSRRAHAHHPRRLFTHNRASACQNLSIYSQQVLPYRQAHDKEANKYQPKVLDAGIHTIAPTAPALVCRWP